MEEVLTDEVDCLADEDVILEEELGVSYPGVDDFTEELVLVEDDCFVEELEGGLVPEEVEALVEETCLLEEGVDVA